MLKRLTNAAVIAITAVGVVASYASARPLSGADSDARRGLVMSGLARDAAACSDGLRIRVPNRPDGCTHGPDPAPAGVDVRDRRPIADLRKPALDERAPAAGASLPCLGDGRSGHRVEAIYAYAADQPDRYEAVAPLIERWAAESSQEFDDSAAETGGSRRVRFLTSSCRLVVRRERLSARGDDDLGATASELSARGYNRSDRNYLVWVDANVYCGIAYVGGPFARVDSGCWGYAETHELVHNLGGVALSSPNSSGGWHCIDEYDVMCYGDSPKYPTMRYVCPDWHERLLDCGHDDYFHTAPPEGKFLSRHPEANVADSSFLADVDGEPPTYLPLPPSGYRGPRYLLRLYNADDDVCAYVVRSGTDERIRVFCIGYRGAREADITGALAALARGAPSAALRIVARNHNPGGGRTVGVTLRRDGEAVLDLREGTVGVESSDLPESQPDPTTGWTTFYDRRLELGLTYPPPKPPSPPTGGGSGALSGDHAAGGCAAAQARYESAAGDAERAYRRLLRERARLRRWWRGLNRRGWPAQESRRYASALRRYRRRLRAYRDLERRVHSLERAAKSACG